MPDLFANHPFQITEPAENAYTVTPDDNNDLPFATRALYVGTGGTVVGIPAGGSVAVPFYNVPVGFMPVRFKRILSAANGTTASNLVALY